jgi:dephospho-CoA kinase
MGAVWVLCGPLASGKSTVATYFAEAGASVMDADRVVAELLAEDLHVQESLRDAFGPDVFDEFNKPDPAAIAARVFADEPARARLEGILHPSVLERLGEEARQFREKPGGILLLEIVLWMKLDPAPFPVDGVCVTLAPPEKLISRATARDGLVEDAARARLAAQAGWEEWATRADVVIDTDCSREALRESIFSYYRAWTQSEEG